MLRVSRSCRQNVPLGEPLLNLSLPSGLSRHHSSIAPLAAGGGAHLEILEVLDRAADIVVSRELGCSTAFRGLLSVNRWVGNDRRWDLGWSSASEDVD